MVSVTDSTAIDLLANVDAMNYALNDPAGSVSVDRIVTVHRRLLEHSSIATHAGTIRTEQNWIGGSDFTPIGAAFIPPPPDLIRGALDDLCVFCKEDMLAAVVQAAIAHAPFETIHPFADENGRQDGHSFTFYFVLLRRRRLALRATQPIFLILATRSKDYVALLDGTRSIGAATPVRAKRFIDGSNPLQLPVYVQLPTLQCLSNVYVRFKAIGASELQNHEPTRLRG